MKVISPVGRLEYMALLQDIEMLIVSHNSLQPHIKHIEHLLVARHMYMYLFMDLNS